GADSAARIFSRHALPARNFDRRAPSERRRRVGVGTQRPVHGHRELGERAARHGHRISGNDDRGHRHLRGGVHRGGRLAPDDPASGAAHRRGDDEVGLRGGGAVVKHRWYATIVLMLIAAPAGAQALLRPEELPGWSIVPAFQVLAVYEDNLLITPAPTTQGPFARV